MTKEETLMKRVRITVVASMMLLFTLVCVLGVQFAIRVGNDNTEQNLQAQVRLLEQQLAQAENDITFFQTREFQEEFALKYLGWGRPGQTIFERPR